MAYLCECGPGYQDGNVTLSTCNNAPNGYYNNATCEATGYTREEMLMFAESIDAGTIGYVYAWGVAAVLTLFFIGYGVGLIKRLINLT